MKEILLEQHSSLKKKRYEKMQKNTANIWSRSSVNYAYVSDWRAAAVLFYYNLK